MTEHEVPENVLDMMALDFPAASREDLKKAARLMLRIMEQAKGGTEEVMFLFKAEMTFAAEDGQPWAIRLTKAFVDELMKGRRG